MVLIILFILDNLILIHSYCISSKWKVIYTNLFSISIYTLFLLLLSIIFSTSELESLISDNFECGFYSLLTLTMRYKFNYRMIIIHFIISEQELLFCFLLIFGLHITCYWMMVFVLILILFVDLVLCLFYPTFLY